MSYQDTINEKRTATQQQATAQGTLDALIGQLKEVQLAQYMGNSKSTVVLADSTDFGEKLDGLSTKFDELITKHSKLLSEASKTDQQLIKNLVSEVRSGLSSLKPRAQDNSDIVRAIKALQMNPTITVPQPKVTVTNAPPDFKPLQRAIENIKMPDIILPEHEDKFDLDDYRAHDIIDGKDKQYVGFMNPEGSWYIIENDLRGNKMRYVFGTTGYVKAFSKAQSYQYETLEEALHATA